MRNIILFLICIYSITALQAQTQPNILLVIADDMGIDVLNGYNFSGVKPTTPTLDSLRANGITFDNVWATPSCTPTRARIMSGKYGVKSGVAGTPGNLDTSNVSLFRSLKQYGTGYAGAVIGKWHISQPVVNDHPYEHGADFFTGVMTSGVQDYYAWDKTENGITALDSSYVTTTLTNEAINWANAQTQPWLLWLAHVAPHTPNHVPPMGMYTVNPTNGYRRYLAMIESLDFELNRTLTSLPDSVRDNTLVIFIGDNGTPGNRTNDYPTGHAKGAVYEGGVRVPMIIAGKGVSRIGEREHALVDINDIYATIIELAGVDLPGGIYNSLSFKHLLEGNTGAERSYAYTEYTDAGIQRWVIRNARYKLIQIVDSTQEFYDVQNDILEVTDLLPNGLSAELDSIKADLEAEAEQIRTAWSCRDNIKNGDEDGIDCGGTFCGICDTVISGIPTPVLSFDVYPNPVDDILQVELSSSTAITIRLMDMNGVVVQAISTTANKVSLELNDLPSAYYLLEVREENGASLVKKVFKK